jgi:hypothetical protein
LLLAIPAFRRRTRPAGADAPVGGRGIRDIERNVSAFNAAALPCYSAMGGTVFQQRLSRTV